MNNAPEVRNLMVLDCTLRDGGYYNSWDFDPLLVSTYFEAMQASGVNVIEVGLRSLTNQGFKGAFAFSTDSFLETLSIPNVLKVAVMINASEFVEDGKVDFDRLFLLFPNGVDRSRVSIVRIACHFHEFFAALPAASWLNDQGFFVGFNLMQIADRTLADVESVAREACQYPVDILYFADSMGSMTPDIVTKVIGALRTCWLGDIGIHTHDNMGLALQNTLRAIDEGVNWLDCTVTGMGRGPGNARTEELVIEIGERHDQSINLVPLMSLIRKYFLPMQHKHGWGTNPYYYLAGKYGIHPSYIQEMLADSRFDESDILAVIQRLQMEGGKKFSFNTLDSARNFYQGSPRGRWQPASFFKGREVLILGTGEGVVKHREAIEFYIRTKQPVVMALNTQSAIAADLIDVRAACHPVRLLADCEAHAQLPQPLITPYSMLPSDVRHALCHKRVFDFGLGVEKNIFSFENAYCIVPTSLVMAYAFSVAASGKCSRILMAGFDGYPGDDPRHLETNGVIKLFSETSNTPPLIAITPSRYDVQCISVYGLINEQ